MDAHSASIDGRQLQGLQEMRWMAVKVATIQILFVKYQMGWILHVKHHRYHLHNISHQQKRAEGHKS